MSNKLTAVTMACALACWGCSDSSDTPLQPALLTQYTLGSDDSVPEGVAFDPEQRNFYATSLQGASITRVAADGSESLFRQPDDRAEILGAQVDAQSRRLWVCARAVDGIDNQVWMYDLNSGELQETFTLGALATNGSCNDLDLDTTGLAYVTDSGNPTVYRLDPTTGEGEVFAASPLLADITGFGLGQNGIAVSPDGTALIVAIFTPPALVRVSLPEGEAVTSIALTGDTLPSPDGIVFVDGDLYTVANASVSRVRLNGDFTAGTVVTVAQRSGLSTAANAEDQLYVIKSEVTNFVLGEPLDLPFEIFRVDTGEFDQ